MRIEWQIAFWLAVLILFGFAGYMFANVLAPFIASLALGYVLDPVVTRLQRLGLSRLAATLVILAIFLILQRRPDLHPRPRSSAGSWSASPNPCRITPTSCKA